MSRADRMGIAAAAEAIAQSGLDLSREDRTRIGVILGGGTSGLLDSEEFFSRHLHGRPARPSRVLNHMPDAITDRVAQRFRARGHQVHHHDGLLLLGQRDGLRARRDRGGPGGRRPDGRLRRSGPTDLRRLQLAALGGSRPVPPLRPRAQGPLDRRGGRDPRLRGARTGAAARRADPRGVSRLRRDVRRVPHDRARPLGIRRGADHPRRARQCRASTPTTWTTSTPTARPRRRTIRPRPRRSRPPSGSARGDPDLLDQVHDRALPLRLRGHRGRRDRPDAARPARPADDPLREPRSGLRPRLRPQRRAGRGRPGRPLELLRVRRQQLRRGARALRRQSESGVWKSQVESKNKESSFNPHTLHSSDGPLTGSSPAPARSLRSGAPRPSSSRGCSPATAPSARSRPRSARTCRPRTSRAATASRRSRRSRR